MKTDKTDNFILLSDAIPAREMKVRWITKDGTIDCGWFDGKEFYSFDPHYDEIVKWQPFDQPKP